MPRRRAVLRRAGMTLIELVVGLAVTGMVAALAYAASASVADHRRRVVEATDEVTRAAAVRRTLRSWLEHAHLEPGAAGPGFRGLDGFAGDLDDDELTLLTEADASFGRGETVLRLFVDRDDGTAERGLVAELSDRWAAGVERVELAPAATGLDVRYLWGTAEAPQWLPSYISTSVLPRALEVTVRADEPEAIPPLLRLPILVTLGERR